MHKVDDDYPHDQLVEAFSNQDAVVSVVPGRPHEVQLRMIDAAVAAGVKRFIPSEYGNNTCAAASQLVPMYGDKAKVIDYLKSKEDTGLTWTAVHTGQFLEMGLETGWLGYDLKEKTVKLWDSGNALWSTSTGGTASAAVARVLLKPEETKNRPVFVASFTLSQRELLTALEKAGGDTWKVKNISSSDAVKRGKELGDENREGLGLLIMALQYADGVDRGANFEKDGLLDNKLLDLPEEDLMEVVKRVLKQAA